MISLHQGQNERVLMKKLEMWRQDAQSVNMDHKWTIQKTFTHTNKNCQIIYCRQSFGLSCKRWKINFSPLFPFFSILVYLFYFFFVSNEVPPPLSGILGFRSGVCIPYTHSFGTDTHTWRFRPLSLSNSKVFSFEWTCIQTIQAYSTCWTGSVHATFRVV